ncbi:MAG: dihydrolipoyl dehydrogenase family protein [Hyphomicrobiaceae bacterium]
MQANSLNATLTTKDAGANKALGKAKRSATGTTQSATGDQIDTDLCVIGAGSGGLSVAAIAAAFGRKVVLVEKGKMGGDCLNYGCVPSKAMLAAGKRAQDMRTAGPFGVGSVEPVINHRDVNAHIKSVIAAIEPNDSVERFTGLGVHVIQAAGRFIDKNTIVAGEYQIKARRFVIATGSSPAIIPFPGLDSIPYFTNETIFENQNKIDHLIVIGGGPIGMEMAQAHRRLGSKVTVLEAFKALGKDDPELTAIALDKIRSEGISVREDTKVISVDGGLGHVRVLIETDEGEEYVNGSHLLMAVGRRPNVEGLGLENAKIKFDQRGIKVDKGLKTANRKVYAIGDVIGGLQFTHVANYHAQLVIKNALFRLPIKNDQSGVPWVTFTDPEIANVGLTESQATQKFGKKINVLRWPFLENDRAQAERTTTGHVKVITDSKGRILGAGIVGKNAGEIIQMWSLAISKKMKVKDMMNWISPYPTLSEVNKRVASRFFATTPSNALVRSTINFLSKFG